MDESARAQLVMLYADILDQTQRAGAQLARATHPLERFVLTHAMYVLQGRLEGVGLAWYVLSGSTEECEDDLRVAAMEIRRGR